MTIFLRIPGVLALALLAAPAVFGADAPPLPDPSTIPAEAFFQLEDMNSPIMSPDGSAVAVLVRNTVGRRQLAVIDTADLHNIKVVASFTTMDVGNARWVDRKRLMFQVWDQTTAAAYSEGSGTFAVDRDGTDLRELMGSLRANNASHASNRLGGSIVRTLDDESGDIVIAHWTHTSPLGQLRGEYTGSTPHRFNTGAGLHHSDMLSGKIPDYIDEWEVDETGQVRAALAEHDGITTLLVPGKPGEWAERARFPSYGRSPTAFTPVEVATDGKFYVSRSTGVPGGGFALYTMDLATGAVADQPLVSAKGFDIVPSLVEDRRQHKVLGVHYVTDGLGTVWFDPAMKALQQKVDAALPGRVNTIDPATCGCAKRVLVISFSDRQPDLYYLYDRGEDLMIPIGIARPAIVARQMAETDFVRIKARDGHDLPVYVTRPRGKGPWPTVVLVHGGPYMRGWEWEWDPESQFLASRGYLVVKPEFRGSDGYGDELRESGYKQWGLKMQDDIADATTWAAAQGFEDPQRTCIAGASYGGYATLMGLARYPELYRCGVAWSAVTDLRLMHDIYWSDTSEQYRTYGMPLLVGDEVADAQQLKDTSPLQLASQIKRPLLLAHGGVDKRVPIDHAKKMLGALQDAHAPVTWIEYMDEAHGWYKPETRVDFYKRMEAFLKTNIGPGTPVAAALAGSTANR